MIDQIHVIYGSNGITVNLMHGDWNLQILVTLRKGRETHIPFIINQKLASLGKTAQGLRLGRESFSITDEWKSELWHQLVGWECNNLPRKPPLEAHFSSPRKSVTQQYKSW
jgi:hypothetical protein